MWEVTRFLINVCTVSFFSCSARLRGANVPLCVVSDHQSHAGNEEKEETFTLNIWQCCASALYHQQSILHILINYKSLWLYITPGHFFNIAAVRKISFFHYRHQSISSHFCVIWKSIYRLLSCVICRSEHKILHISSLFFLLNPVFYNQRPKRYQMSSLMDSDMDQL